MFFALFLARIAALGFEEVKKLNLACSHSKIKVWLEEDKFQENLQGV